ncbi:MAG: hypothetical protein Q8P39_01760 [Candidatus Yanofskybacteria bacterium]|nr:hypothetical protein [Candidatus Yanofskybacteria bacterium]
MIRNITAVLPLILAAVPLNAWAHCPLCTAGAAAAGGIAVWMGVSMPVIGMFLGAAAFSMGWWISRGIKRRFVPFQIPLIIAGTFASVILPLIPLFQKYGSVYIAIVGAYGTLLHNVYLVNLFLLGSGVGAALVLVSPYISKGITFLRKGKAMPYQGLMITFFLLLAVALITEAIL